MGQIHSPKAFVFHVGKDLLVNHRDIFQEISTAVVDYKARNFTDFGVQVGMALRKLIVGDMLTAAGATAAKEAEFIAVGLVEGFVSDQPDLQTCVGHSGSSVKDVEEAVKDFEKKTASGVLAGLRKLSESLDEIPKALEACKASAADVEHIVDALKQIHSP